jgi:hypothetical protein
MIVRLLLAAALVALLAAAVAAPAASARTVTCEPGKYSPELGEDPHPVRNLRAIDLPRLTDGYAPRCLVAEGLASRVAFDVGEGRKPPARVKVFGARWYGGSWRCKYRSVGDHRNASCRQSGHAKRRVTFELHA